MEISARAVKTKFFDVGDSLFSFIVESVPKSLMVENLVLAVTSKIVSLAENRLVPLDSVERAELIAREADEIVGHVSHNHTMTLKHGLLIPGAGIDSSNSKDLDYILYPKDPWKSAQDLGADLRAHYGLKNLGVILTDSHSVPMRRGVTGISLAHWGFRGVRDCIGQPDLYGRPLKFTKQNVADALASTAVLLMGEGNESQPLVLLKCDQLVYFDGADREELLVKPEDDLYLQLLNRR